MNHIQHLPKCPYIRPPVGRKQAELRPPILSRYGAAQTSNPVKSHLIKRIDLQPFAADIFPHISVPPVHNGVTDPLPLKLTVFKQPTVLIIVIVQNNLLARIRYKVFKHPTVVLPLHALCPAHAGGDKPIPAGVLFENFMESFP